MKHGRTQTARSLVPRWYRGADVPIRLIRRFAREVAERFRPEKIILFGSHAYGTPHADSDVDILVIMPTRNELDQSVKICLAVDYNFPLDLLVRTPQNLSWRLGEGDSFLREVMERGKVLYEKTNSRLAPQSRSRSSRGAKTRTKPAAQVRTEAQSSACGRDDCGEESETSRWRRPLAPACAMAKDSKCP